MNDLERSVKVKKLIIETKLCDFCKGRAHVKDEILLELELLVGAPSKAPNFKYAEHTTIHACKSCCKSALFSHHSIDSCKNLDIDKRVAANIKWLEKQRVNKVD